MYISVLLLLWVSSKCAGNFCEIWDALHCYHSTQEEFYESYFRDEYDMKKQHITTIEIINSTNFSVIEVFRRPRSFSGQYIEIKHLRFIESQIKFVSDTAFIEWDSLEYLALSRNRIHNISFLKYLPHTVSKVDLSYNELTILDLNLVQFHEISLSHNKINYLERIKDNRYNFDKIDLSYNNLVNFNELVTNSFSNYLDISYNQLEKLVLDNSYKIRDTVNIMRNNITYFGPKHRLDFWCNNLLATNLSSVNFGYIDSSLIMRGSKVGVLDEEFLALTKFKKYISCEKIINLSNSSISAISPSFFSDTCISELNLSYNNISSLEKPIFKYTLVKVINLAYSGIRTISERTFNGAQGCHKIILKGNFLKDIPNICRDSSIAEIDLSSNKIERISIDTLVGCDLLIWLDLSFNSIHYFEPGAFHGSEGLQFLDVSNNNITLENETMSNLSEIGILNVSNNNMEVIGTNAFTNLSITCLEIFSNPVKIVKTKAFNNLYHLRVLDLSKTGMKVLEKHAFFDLPSIQTIDLSENRLSTILSYTFSNIPVKEILLKGNQIFRLKTQAFYRLPYLSNLDLSKQKITEIEYHSFSDLFVGNLDLRYNNITHIGGHIFDNVSIERLYINENKITKLNPIGNNVKIGELNVELRGKLDKGVVSNMYLEKLILTNSHIEVIENGAFNGAYSLNEITFKNTSVISYQPDILRNLFNLTHFDFHSFLSKQRKVKKYMFRDIGRLEEMTLNHLGLTEIENFAFIGLKSLKNLSLVRNRITKINLDSFNGLEQLMCLNLSRNAFVSINLTFIKTLSNLDTLDLSYNKLTYISCNFEIYSNLTTLYLNHNDFSDITSETFSKLYSMETLYLNHNVITHINSYAFAKLEHLKYLNLDNNLLHEVAPDSFKCLKRLESLYLGHNFLRYIPLNTFQHLSILRDLNLGYNELAPFQNGVFNGPQNLKTLDISYNNRHYMSSVEFTPLRSLSKLIHLNLDSYGLEDDFDHLNIRSNFPFLQSIQINYNDFNCSKLLDMLKFFDTMKIEYTPLKPEHETSNHFGIRCQDSYPLPKAL